MPEPLYRSHEVLLRADMAGRTLHGRIVPYGEVADVSDGGPRYRERFERGAFTRSIAERGHKVRLFIQHETQRLPIAKAVDLAERADGVHAGFAVARTREGDDALELVNAGIVDGFSIGFMPVRDRREGDVTVRTEASLREVSLVHSPAYTGALVTGVRSTAPPTWVDAARRRLALRMKDLP